MPWQILYSGSNPAEVNMQRDRLLLDQLEHTQEPILHLYQWEGLCATYGYFLQLERHLDLTGVQAHALQLARRPTGGGIIFHVTDYAFSALVPASYAAFSVNTLENYAFINTIVSNAVAPFVGQAELLVEEQGPLDAHCSHFCMAKPTVYDVMLHGCKIAGAAQRRTRFGYLHQGSICLAMPPEKMITDVLGAKLGVWQAMQQYSYPLLPTDFSAMQLQDLRQAIQSALIAQIKLLP